MSDREAETRVLEMIAGGQVTAAEGLRLLQTVRGGTSAEPPQAQPERVADTAAPLSPRAETEPPIPNGLWGLFWTVPFWVGVMVIVGGAWWLFRAYLSTGFSFGFFCAGLLLLVGLAILVFANQLRSGSWLHIRIHKNREDPSKNIHLLIPAPLHFASWFVRTFSGWIPSLRSVPLDALAAALAESTQSGEQFLVHVNSKDGDEVDVSLGQNHWAWL